MDSHTFWSGLLVATAAGLMLLGCGDNVSSPAPLTVDDAITRAQERIADEGYVSVDYGERDTSVVEEGGAWHISFPLKIDTTIYKIGGEPHVLISKSDGEILSVYYTR